MILWLDYIIWVIFVLINVAFITLLERKILSLSQNRVGPNKVSLMGLLQPMSDAVKLFTKHVYMNYNMHTLPMMLAPSLFLMMAMSLWLVNKLGGNIISSNYTIMAIIMIMSLSVYPTILAGALTNSKYSYLGATRSVAQTISYEVILILFFMIIILYNKSLMVNPTDLIYLPSILLIQPLLVMMWIMALMAESNRTPFDFAEGESELVSGFNTEYAASGFALIFMAEYMMIYYMSLLTTYLFLSNTMFVALLFSFMMIFLYIWIRATYPRHRYDLLMQITWKSLVPVITSILLLVIVLMSMFGSKVH
uniref:NADH-ubiquinone oxidoreductase chain 1 n=1 Tax=Lernaea cyprinacea TaxID=342429 RepID=A0A0U1XFU4_9MAXI|nr:NADH dehydrogenase subunit 1 [Lernaea cyprinacea]AIQ80149.1 NADH dehydrogenase subunit 1 [Lernaea cyprinacea]